jgi:hypothetical protein
VIESFDDKSCALIALKRGRTLDLMLHEAPGPSDSHSSQPLGVLISIIKS